MSSSTPVSSDQSYQPIIQAEIPLPAGKYQLLHLTKKIWAAKNDWCGQRNTLVAGLVHLLTLPLFILLGSCELLLYPFTKGIEFEVSCQNQQPSETSLEGQPLAPQQGFPIPIANSSTGTNVEQSFPEYNPGNLSPKYAARLKAVYDKSKAFYENGHLSSKDREKIITSFRKAEDFYEGMEFISHLKKI